MGPLYAPASLENGRKSTLVAGIPWKAATTPLSWSFCSVSGLSCDWLPILSAENAEGMGHGVLGPDQRA